MFLEKLSENERNKFFKQIVDIVEHGDSEYSDLRFFYDEKENGFILEKLDCADFNKSESSRHYHRIALVQDYGFADIYPSSWTQNSDLNIEMAQNYYFDFMSKKFPDYVKSFGQHYKAKIQKALEKEENNVDAQKRYKKDIENLSILMRKYFGKFNEEELSK